MTMLLALDSGFGNTKLYFKFENTSYVRDFESRVKETNLKTDSTLIINGKMYDFKDAPLATEMGHKTKEDEIHRVLRNKALYEVYKITGEKNRYQIKPENNKFKITKLSNTSNPNIIFEITLIGEQNERDLEKFKSEFID